MRIVKMLPTSEEALNDTTNSINQIVLRLAEYLPKYGWTLGPRKGDADLIAAHAGQTAGVAPCDVTHCHGLYPTKLFPEYKAWFAINKNVVDNLKYARRITVPSNWVADILRREMNLTPDIIPWAIEPSEWTASPHKSYTLWNKTRADSVCDPEPVRYLATAIPSAQFATTFYPKNQEAPSNVTVYGRKPYLEMKELVKHAALYLATTKETFGIGILEAMACKIPILGFNFGAVPDYVTHGYNGFLAEPYDWNGLLDGWHYCMAHRQTLGENAFQTAQKYSWDRVAEQFANVYDQVYREKTKSLVVTTTPKVSVIIPNHNYAKYVLSALNSVISQETDFKFELIIVLDSCTDESDQLVCDYREQFAASNENLNLIKIIRVDYHNVALTRNRGIKEALGEFIVCLDADDMLGSPKFLQILYDACSKNPLLGIAYTGLGMIQADVQDRFVPSNWPPPYDGVAHFHGVNQIPTCCMFRKQAWARALGYKFYLVPSEDADLWTRIILDGWEIQQVTPEHIFYYRVHKESLTADIRAGFEGAANWLFFHPWRINKQFPVAANVKGSYDTWPVGNYDQPQISIIIPVGPNHTEHVKRALDSVRAQTFDQWECIVVNNSGSPLQTYPWVKLINAPEEVHRASVVRNLGVSHSQAPLITFLDADDYLDPTFLEETIRKYRQTGKYVYSDWVSLKTDGSRELGKASEYSIAAVFNSHVLHTINIVIPRTWFNVIGGFDESFDTWEDIELFMRLAKRGYCGVRVPQPLIYYDYSSGSLREFGMTKELELKAKLVSLYGEFMGEGAKMCSCTEVRPTMTQEELIQAALSGEMIRTTYIGATAKQTVVGGATKQNYGRRQHGDIFYVWREDFSLQPERFVPTPINDVMILNQTEIPPAP